MSLSSFPGDLDTWTTKVDNTDDVDDDHINKLQDAVDALEIKVGKNSSAVITTLDYLLKNTASESPGHKHYLADGAKDITASAAEVNLIDGSVAGTAVASKALVLGANKNVDTLVIADSGLKLGAGAGTAITSTAAELNVLDGAVLTDHCILLGNGTGVPIGALGAAGNGQIPIGSVGADPVIANITAGTGISITNGAGTITITAAFVGSAMPSVTAASSGYSEAVLAADTERHQFTTGYLKVKQITINRPGTYTVVFQLSGDESGDAYAKIYKGGGAYGSEQHAVGSSYELKAENLAFAAGETCELWGKSASGTCHLQCFRLYCNDSLWGNVDTD